MKRMMGTQNTPSATPPSAGCIQAGTLRRAVTLLDRAQRGQEHRRQHGHEDREHGVEREVLDDEREAARVREERRLAEDRDDDGVGDDAGEDRGDERVRLEVVAVEHLDGEERGAERRAEDGGDAGRDARDHEDAPLRRRHVEDAADPGAERAADLHRRPLAPARAARAEREHRREQLDPGDAPADDAAVLVEGVDHGVAAAAARLGRELRDEAAGERAERREEQAAATSGRGGARRARA